MHEYRGECLCGAVRYLIRAEAPRAMFYCHCSRCRKESGTVHCANVFFSGGELAWERGGDDLTRFSLPGTRKARVFCTTCGSPMPRQNDGGRIVLPAGSLDDGAALEPTAHIYCDSRADWEDGIEAVKRLPEGP